MTSKQCTNRAANYAHHTDSNMMLKEQMVKLNDMELVCKNDDELGKTSDEESIA